VLDHQGATFYCGGRYENRPSFCQQGEFLMSSNYINMDEGLLETRRLLDNDLNRARGGFGELTAYLAASSGKGVRTQVLLNAAMDEAGKVPKDAARAAAAVELLHMATLVHDDVIDDADIRRGKTTLHKKFGNKNAILCGDYLLSLSMTSLAGLEMQKTNSVGTHAFLAQRMAKVIAAICKGEFSQHLNAGNVDLQVFAYLRVIAGKTAALFYFSALMGGLIGGESEASILALGSFGRQLGMVFQIIDDCKDYEWSETAAQKPVGNDLKNGVVTLPLILAINKVPALREQALEVIKDNAAVAPVLAAVRAADGPGMARQMAQRYENVALKTLVDIAPNKRGALISLLRSVL